MPDFLSLHDAEQIAAEAAPVVKPGLARVFAGMIQNPAETLRQAFEHPIPSYALIFAGAGGVYWALNFAVLQASGQTASLPMLLSAVVLLGIPLGIAYLFLVAILMNWSADILGGRPTRMGIRMLLAYVGVPGLVALVLFGLPKMLIFGQGLFMPERAWMSQSPALAWGLWFGDAVCFTWSLMLLVKGLRIMNGFSAGRAVAAVLLPLGPVALIGLLFVLIAGVGLFTTPAF